MTWRLKIEIIFVNIYRVCHPGIEDPLCLCTEPGCREDLNCTVERDRYICVCNSQYTGRFCDMPFDPCLSNPCKNGMCIQDSLLGFTCQCQHGFTGKLIIVFIVVQILCNIERCSCHVHMTYFTVLITHRADEIPASSIKYR